MLAVMMHVVFMVNVCWHVITELNVIYLAYFTLHWTCVVILHNCPVVDLCGNGIRL